MYVVLPSFPWHASTSVHDGRRPFFPVTPYSPFTGPCTLGVPRTWLCPVFHGARPLLSTMAIGNSFPCPCIARSRIRVRVRVCAVCLVCGFAQFSMARVHFRPRRASTIFLMTPYSPLTGPCKGSCTWGVPHTWFCPVFHGARPLLSMTGIGHFFLCPRIASSRVRVRVRVRGVCHCHAPICDPG